MKLNITRIQSKTSFCVITEKKKRTLSVEQHYRQAGFFLNKWQKIWFSLENTFQDFKGQMKSEYIYEIVDFPRSHSKNLIDVCFESLFRLGMLCTHLSRVVLRIIKTNYMYLVYKTFQCRNQSNFFGGTYFGKSMIS